jgi:hypothetical protein
MLPRSVLHFLIVLLFDVLIPLRPALASAGHRAKTRAANQ